MYDPGLTQKITIDAQKVICPVDYQQSGVINDDVRCFANLITG
jgi:hypothetical protein